MRPPVVITGLGCVSPLGRDPASAFDQAYRSRSAIKAEKTGPDELEVEMLLARVDFDAGDAIPRRQLPLMARAAQMSVVAAQNALVEAGLEGDDRLLAGAGIYIGCTLGGDEATDDAYLRMYSRRTRRLRPTTVPLIMANGPASHVSMCFGIEGPAYTYSIACASSAVAIGEAFRAVRDGRLEIAVAGGAEAMLNSVPLAAWARLGVIAQEHPNGPAASCRPFDVDRSGMVLGEGAAVMILESEDHAVARGAVPIAQVVGYGASSDAKGLTDPSADGLVRCMAQALSDARLTPDAIGYVNAHATGTVSGDPVEIAAIERVFGEAAERVAISSTKGVHGHLVGAAGALEAMITALALQQGRIPPTANLTRPDPTCNLDCVPLEGRPAPDLEFALSNSFAFGGSNATLVFKRA